MVVLPPKQFREPLLGCLAGEPAEDPGPGAPSKRPETDSENIELATSGEQLRLSTVSPPDLRIHVQSDGFFRLSGAFLRPPGGQTDTPRLLSPDQSEARRRSGTSVRLRQTDVV